MNPVYIWGLENFDSIKNSIYVVFECMTGEGWSSILYLYWNGYNAAITSIYFCFIIIIGNFFLLNMILAAINNSFLQFERNEDIERLRTIQKNKKGEVIIFFQILKKKSYYFRSALTLSHHKVGKKTEFLLIYSKCPSEHQKTSYTKQPTSLFFIRSL